MELNPSLQSVFSGNFTVSMWIYNVADVGTYDALFNTRLNGAPFQGIRMHKAGTDEKLEVLFDLGTTFKDVDLNYVLTDGNWYCIVLKREGINLSVWVNGGLELSDASAGNDADISNAAPVHVGSNRVNASTHDGLTDEMGFWNVAKTDAEIGEMC